MQDSSTTFIYALCDPRYAGAIRYVGKANDPVARLRSHICEAKRCPVNHRDYWIRGVQEAGFLPELFIVEECPRLEWIEFEQFWISYFRFLGLDLTNLTNGGDGGEGVSPTAATRAKMSAAAKVKVFTPEHRAKLAETLRKHPPGPEARARSAENRSGDFCLMSPDGEEFQVRNLSAFCRERGLSRSNLCSLLAGRIQYNKGWRIWRPGEPVPPAPVPKSVRMSEKFKGRDIPPEWRAKIAAGKSMHFIATMPTGEEIYGSNLVAFCAEHGLNRQSMQRILKGEIDQVKGWRIRRLEDT